MEPPGGGGRAGKKIFQRREAHLSWEERERVLPDNLKAERRGMISRNMVLSIRVATGTPPSIFRGMKVHISSDTGKRNQRRAGLFQRPLENTSLKKNLPEGAHPPSVADQR